MKKYDVRCPKCGTVNRSLYLKETGGRMECIECGEVSRVFLKRCISGETGRPAAIRNFFRTAEMPAGQGA